MGGDDDSLIGGNLNDSEFVDIADFGIYVGQYNANYGTGNTMCSTPSPHADSSGNGTVFTEDFTFIQINYLKQREANCCSLPNFLASPEQTGEKPITSITVAKLREQGVANPSAADLNGDGVVDQADFNAWLAGARPGQPLPAPRRR